MVCAETEADTTLASASFSADAGNTHEAAERHEALEGARGVNSQRALERANRSRMPRKRRPAASQHGGKGGTCLVQQRNEETARVLVVRQHAHAVPVTTGRQSNQSEHPDIRGLQASGARRTSDGCKPLTANAAGGEGSIKRIHRQLACNTSFKGNTEGTQQSVPTSATGASTCSPRPSAGKRTRARCARCNERRQTRDQPTNSMQPAVRRSEAWQAADVPQDTEHERAQPTTAEERKLTDMQVDNEAAYRAAGTSLTASYHSPCSHKQHSAGISNRAQPSTRKAESATLSTHAQHVSAEHTCHQKTQASAAKATKNKRNAPRQPCPSRARWTGR